MLGELTELPEFQVVDPTDGDEQIRVDEDDIPARIAHGVQRAHSCNGPSRCPSSTRNRVSVASVSTDQSTAIACDVIALDGI